MLTTINVVGYIVALSCLTFTRKISIENLTASQSSCSFGISPRNTQSAKAIFSNCYACHVLLVITGCSLILETPGIP